MAGFEKENEETICRKDLNIFQRLLSYFMTVGKVYTKYDKVVLENAKVTLFGMVAFNLDTEQFEM